VASFGRIRELAGVERDVRLQLQAARHDLDVLRYLVAEHVPAGLELPDSDRSLRDALRHRLELIGAHLRAVIGD